MEIKICFAVLAGGVGSRMGGASPKQFIKVGGREILLRSVDAFLPFVGEGELLVTSPEEYVDFTQKLIDQNCAGRVRVIPGGSDRNGSIENVIKEIRRNHLSDDCFLVTHDAARPFVTKKIIEDCIALCKEGKANAVALPVTDTIAVCRDGRFEAITRRSEMFACQTPQCFPVKWFEEAYAALPPEERAVQTDACAMLLRAGREVMLVQGDSRNIKLTTPFDLEIAGAILSGKEE